MILTPENIIIAGLVGLVISAVAAFWPEDKSSNIDQINEKLRQPGVVNNYNYYLTVDTGNLPGNHQVIPILPAPVNQVKDDTGGYHE